MVTKKSKILQIPALNWKIAPRVVADALIILIVHQVAAVQVRMMASKGVEITALTNSKPHCSKIQRRQLDRKPSVRSKKSGYIGQL